MLASLLSDLKLFLILFLISILIIVFDNLKFLNLPKAAVQTVTVPIQYGLYKTYLSISRQFGFIILARRASQENKALTEQLAQVLSENSRLRKKLSETEGLLAQQNSLNPQTFNLVEARPIGISRYLMINKGSDDGLKVGQAVIFKDNFIGKIKEINPKKSAILLASDPDFKTTAFVSNAQGKARGVLLGQFGSEMLLDKVVHQEPLNKNDLVYSEGAEIEVPRGLILGQVSEVNSEDNQVFKQAKVKPVFDVTNLDIVFVITN